MPKYVASRTLKQPLDWNATIIQDNIVEEILKLKQKLGNGLIQYGIGELTDTMLKNELIDEIQLIVFPFTFGKGERWFEIIDISNFKLLDCKSFRSGAILIRYQPIYSS